MSNYAIQRRAALLKQAENDLEFRQAVLTQSAVDPCYWINNWVWAYDPRCNPATIPFDMFPKQGEFVRWLETRIENSEDGLAEQSRDAGLSWLCIAFATWQWLYVPGSKITFGSRKADLVDQLGNPDSLFEKIRILLKSLPTWMLPEQYSDSGFCFINKDNGCTITGEAGDNIGKGGRSTLYFLMDFAFIENAHNVDKAVSGRSEVTIYVSASDGPDNFFAAKRLSEQYPVFRIHWTEDPRKSSKWYARMETILDPVSLAREINIRYDV